MNHYMKTGKENIHAASILISAGIVAGIAAVISGMMKRGLNKDFVDIARRKLHMKKKRQERAKMPKTEDKDEASLTSKPGVKTESSSLDVAWKKVHGDVFRNPGCSDMLACFVGAGA